MIVKSLTWCTYKNNKYVLPGQAVPLTKGVCLKQINANYSDSNKILTDRGLVDVDRLVQDAAYDNAFLPEKENTLNTMHYRGKNYPLVGNESIFYKDTPLVTCETVRAKDWASTGGSMLELDEPHAFYVAVEVSSDELHTEVWCPTAQRMVCLKVIDVPIVLRDMADVELSFSERCQLMQKTPLLDKKWWIWNGITDSASRQEGSREDWLRHPDTYVNVKKGLPDRLRGHEYYYKVDPNYRRMFANTAIPPAGKFAEI